MKFKFFKFLDNAFTDALFPPDLTCDLCGRDVFDKSNFCADCAKKVKFNNGVVCPVCGRKTVRDEICIECKDSAPLYKKAASPLVYEDGAIQLVAKYKNGCAYLKEYFADLICGELKTFPKFDAIVYVPMTKKAKFKRGYNQSELLAKSISKRTGVNVIDKAITKIKDTPEQKSLSRKEREANLAGCFKVENYEKVKGLSLLLVDDVLTTGATADAVTRKLLRAGAVCVYLVTVASVEYKPKNKNVKP